MNAQSWFVVVSVLATIAPVTVRAQALDSTEGSSNAAPAQSEAVSPPESLPWQLSKQYPIDEDNPEMSIPNKRQRDRNPIEYGYLLQDLIEGAEMARKQGDFHGVVRYDRAIVKAVPERAKSWGMLCDAYATVNDHERASKACGTALSLPGVELQDYMRYVRETLLLPGKPKAETVTKLKDVLDHLDKQPGIELAAAEMRCQVGVAAGDSHLLELGTATLTRLDPNNPKTVVYQWTLAMQRGQTDAAGRLLKRAKALKLPSENIERMEALTASGNSRRTLWTGLAAIVFLAAAGGALVLARRRRAQLTLAVR
jgi:predicted Zn-dependent protease